MIESGIFHPLLQGCHRWDLVFARGTMIGLRGQHLRRNDGTERVGNTSVPFAYITWTLSRNNCNCWHPRPQPGKGNWPYDKTSSVLCTGTNIWSTKGPRSGTDILLGASISEESESTSVQDNYFLALQSHWSSPVRLFLSIFPTWAPWSFRASCCMFCCGSPFITINKFSQWVPKGCPLIHSSLAQYSACRLWVGAA